MRLFTINCSDTSILKSLNGLGLILIGGGRIELRAKLQQLSNTAPADFDEIYMHHSINNGRESCELGIVYKKSHYTTQSAIAAARSEYKHITGNDLDVV